MVRVQGKQTIELGVVHETEKELHVGRIQPKLVPLQPELTVDCPMQQRGHGCRQLLSKEVTMSVKEVDLPIER